MRLTPLVASTFFSDGGTMFGLVPKGIWARRLPPDDRNRIAQHAHSLLVELDDGRRGLVDTGCGPAENFSDKEIDVHGLGPGWPLRDALGRRGVELDALDFVVFTHLHWDHAGGARAPRFLKREISFPNARFFMHRFEWEDAASGNALLFKSYPPEIMKALESVGDDRRVLLTDRDREVAPGLRLVRSGGHTRGHGAVVFEGDGLEIERPGADGALCPRLAVFAGDVCPTQHHLRMVFQTAYDTFPLDTRAWKRQWLPRLAREQGWLLFDHDPDLYGATLREDPREEFAVVSTLEAEGRPPDPTAGQ
jgi:glyoxylase-like metal-dependent hydrolase (beta-lactamase superfamily II)